jgi:3-oxoadipate enol-lactonase
MTSFVIPDQTSVVTAPDGARLSVFEYGTGRAVLFIGGLGYSSWSWYRQVGPISQIARAVTLDNRGTGQSDKPSGPYSIEQMAEDAHAVLTQRDARPAHVVGASMGGYIALTLALRHPDAVESLVLLASSAGGPGSHAVPEATLRAWRRAAYFGPLGFAQATMPLSFAAGWTEEHPDEFAEVLSLRQGKPTPTAAWRYQFAAAQSFLYHGLPRGELNVPAVVVHGTADRVVPYENAVHLTKRLPQASLVTLEGAGHLCWIERADEVNRIISKAVRGDGVVGR